jgi:hypothetical protein
MVSRSVRTCSRRAGPAFASTDEENFSIAIRAMLAETEWISPSRLAAPRLPAAVSLIRRGVIAADESLVVCITGNGYKTRYRNIGGRCAEEEAGPRSAARSRSSKRTCDGKGLTAGAGLWRRRTFVIMLDGSAIGAIRRHAAGPRIPRSACVRSSGARMVGRGS